MTENNRDITPAQNRAREMWAKKALPRRKRLIELESRSTTDSLTGLLNRGGFNEKLSREITRSGRTGQPITLMLVEMDNFKQVNDTFGHNKGDAVLIELADLLKHSFREIDHVARWGGDEFAVVLTGTHAEDTLQKADEVRELIADEFSRYKMKKSNSSLTATIGLAEYKKGQSIEQLTELADQAMYKAKDDGKNQVAMSTGGKIVFFKDIKAAAALED